MEYQLYKYLKKVNFQIWKERTRACSLVYRSGIELRGGGDRGLGHCTISENPKVGHCTKPLKSGFKAFLGPFKLKNFLAAPSAPQNVKNAHFWAQKWATERNFRRLRRRKWATVRLLVTPPPFGRSPHSIPGIDV